MTQRTRPARQSSASQVFTLSDMENYEIRELISEEEKKYGGVLFIELARKYGISVATLKRAAKAGGLEVSTLRAAGVDDCGTGSKNKLFGWKSVGRLEQFVENHVRN